LVTKEDMALVPVGKRHKKVEKRQPVGARIRTLDEPERVFAMGEASAESSSARGVSARILALGNRPKIVRNVLAAIGLAVLFVAAIWFIIIPKLQSTQEPLTSNVSAQTANDVRAEAAAQNLRPAPTQSVSETPAAAPAPSDTPVIPAPPVKREAFRVAIATFGSRGDANHELDLLTQLHPEFIFQIVMTKSDATDIRYTVTVGGVLNRVEAEQLLRRVLAKGLKTAFIDPVKK
jgi:cell division septation protein DedD